MESPNRGAVGQALTREIDPREALRWLGRNWAVWLVGVGALLRVAEYLADRPYWLDETSLSLNLVDVPILATPAPLQQDQLAPPGFLLLERVVAHLFGTSRLSLRLVPLVCGVLALPMFARVARRLLGPGAAPIALALFALSIPLNVHGAELKPYSGDAAAALACYLMALNLEATRNARGAVALAAGFGSLIVWFSFPSALVLAGVGLVWIAREWNGGRRRSALVAVGTCGLWLLSFAACYLLSLSLLDPRTGMWVFWHFAFPPRSVEAVSWLARHGLNLFSNPFELDTPLGATASALLAFALFLCGCASLGSRRPWWLVALLLPLPLALTAAALHAYPFHGRLLLFTLPALYLIVGEGLARVGARIGRRAYAALLVFVLVVPAWDALYHLSETRDRPFSPTGDFRPNPFLRSPGYRDPAPNGVGEPAAAGLSGNPPGGPGGSQPGSRSDGRAQVGPQRLVRLRRPGCEPPGPPGALAHFHGIEGRFPIA